MASAAPALAASGSNYFVCPTTYDKVFTGASSANITSAVAQSAYDPDGKLAAVKMAGTTFGVSFDPADVVPVPIYGASGKVVKQSTGLYLLPGCGTTTCVPDVINGFTLPKDGVVLYDGYGAPHKGRIVSATPTGCSPSTNTGTLMSWNIQTDIQHVGAVCRPIAGPENFVSQMSIPLSLVYLDGLKVVNTATGGSCCLYLNLFFKSNNDCVGGQGIKDLTFGSGWSLTSGLPAAPAVPCIAPHIDFMKLTTDWTNIKTFTDKDNVRYLVGGGFLGATSVKWGTLDVTYEVISDTVMKLTLPTTGNQNARYYDITVKDNCGTSPTGSTNVAVARYAG